jgi:dihydropyrimidinase
MTDPDLIVVGGTVVNHHWSGPATVITRGGRIAQLLAPGEDLPAMPGGTRVVDASGRLVLPGGVDPHTHIGMSIGEHTTKDGYPEATAAALWGGTTTVVDFAIPTARQTPLEAVLERRRAAETGLCDAALHGCVIEWNDTIPEQLRAMAQLGVRTIKLFTTYRDQLMAGPDTILRVMDALRDLGGMAYVHAESNHLVEHDQQNAAAAGRISAAGHASTRSELAELTAVREVLATARALGTPVYFVHQTTPEAIDEVRRARADGVLAYTETCPHYLTLNETTYEGDSPELYVCCPPLRPPSTVAAVRQRALSRHVDTIGSDHCCYDLAQKRADSSDVRTMPNGMPGVETRLPVIFTEMVSRRGMSLEHFVTVTSSNPARLNGIYPRKGAIAPGSDADMILIDPTEIRTVSAKELHTLSDYSPYEKKPLSGWASTVILRGRVVIDDEKLQSDTPTGIAISSSPISQRQLIC